MSSANLGTIMVALDGSDFAEAALEPARDLARRSGAAVHLVSVHERGPGWSSDLWPTPEMDRWREEYLERVAEDVAEETGSAVTRALPESNDVPRELLAQVEDSDADLLVLSTHGRGRLSRSWLGNVAATLLHDARIPLLVVRPPEEEDEAVDASSAEGEDDPVPAPVWTEPGTILVALDGTPESEAVVEPALRLARLYGAALHLVRVAPFPRAYSSPYIPHAVEINRQVVNAAEEEARSYLADVRGRLVPDEVEATTQVVVAGQPARGILAAAGEAGADMLALASHHGTLHRFALGSTADKVVRASRLPLLLVRTGDA